MSVRQAEAGNDARIDNTRNVRDAVEQRIQEMISTGQLGGDRRLPTERELAEQLGVSRTTVRQVLDRLEHEGSVHRRRGRAGGTFVSRGREWTSTSATWRASRRTFVLRVSGRERTWCPRE